MVWRDPRIFAFIGRKGAQLAGKDISISIRDMERLIDWMRRTGKPQTIETLVRRYVEMLREERGIR
jgi:hypothetical protein